MSLSTTRVSGEQSNLQISAVCNPRNRCAMRWCLHLAKLLKAQDGCPNITDIHSFVSTHALFSILSITLSSICQGVMACPEGKTQDGFETQFGINYLAHFLLFQLLKPTLLASSSPSFHSRVVSLSSSAHRMSPVHLDDLDLKKAGYDPWVAYGQSKTASIHMATEIERRYGSQGLHASAVHPGSISTTLQRYLRPEFVQMWSSPELERKMKSPEQGAATTVWAAIGSEWEGTGGKYLEDCRVSEPIQDGEDGGRDPGFVPHAYDEDVAKELWVISLRLVGLHSDG
jgi:NAD(P)-dependent dehydrogenase (short-subunit alcohol dehydrogenase family)